MRPTTAYFPIRRRGAFAGWSAGSISSLVEAEEENGDVVLPALRVPARDQGLRRLVHVAAGVPDEARDLLVRDHRGEPVRAEEEDVARLDLVELHVDLEVGLAPQRARDHVVQRVRARLVGRDDAGLDLL